MRILFITANRIGDAVLTTGLLEYLLRTQPAARFTVACGPAAAGLFERMPQRDATLVFDKRRFDLHWPGLWARAALTQWDLAIDLRGSAITYFLPARKRLVMRGGRRSGHRLGHIGAVLGLDPPPLPVTWTAPKDEALAARTLPAGTPVIGLGPTANWNGKVWPPDRFVALYRALSTGPLPGARAAVFAGPGPAEQALAAPVLAAIPDAIDLAGRLSLPEAAACLARCALFVGNDSGLMHLAAAAGAPTLGLFGPSMASQYAPAGRRTGFAVAPGPEGEAAIADLTVDTALAAISPLLAAVHATEAA